MKEPATLHELFVQSLERHPRPDRYRRRSGDAWVPVSAVELDGQVKSCAAGLAGLGVGRGDRVVLLSYNRLEWAVTDWACHRLGAVNVPIYSTLPADACGYILRDSGAQVAVVENEEQAAKVEGVVPHVVRMDRFDAFLGDAGAPPDPATCGADDLATLIYTSGTTGEPKGVMLTHRNLVSNLLSVLSVLEITERDEGLSFLPLCHSFQRILDYALFHAGSTIAHAESIDKLVGNLQETRPTILGAVPRVYEKFRDRVLQNVEKKGGLAKAIFNWSRNVGIMEAEYRKRGERAPFSLRWRYAVARKLVLNSIAGRLGGRMRLLVSGGAPLGREVGDFLWSLGLTLLEGYGLTETSPVLCVSLPGRVKSGTVGPPIPGVELKIADDGEILARGPNIMKGYYNKPEATAEVLRDGWFATGDIGELDEEGRLRITDRKKDLLKTAGGKYIAPQPIESALKARPRILNAVVIGDARPYPAALIVPEPGATEAEVQEDLDAVNAGLPQYEKIKRFALLDRDFTLEAGEITPTLKVKRKVVVKKHADRIDALYARPKN